MSEQIIQQSDLDKKFFQVYENWDGNTWGPYYTELWSILMEAVRLNLLSQLRKTNCHRRDAEELVLEAVCRFFPRLIEKKRHNYIPPYGPVALTSMDTNYILYNDKRKQEDRESVDYDNFTNIQLEKEKAEECF